MNMRECRNSRLPSIQYIGTVRISIISGVNLFATTETRGKKSIISRPCCRVRLGNFQSYQTPAGSGPSPEWQHSGVLSVSSLDDVIKIEVFNIMPFAPEGKNFICRLFYAYRAYRIS